MARDAVATMGDVLPDDVGGRDAVHVAVLVVIASDKLYPGQFVGLLGRHHVTDEHVVGSKGGIAEIGIVDPFITRIVMPGERFWMYLKPRTITGLNHNWTHPAFEDVAATYAPPTQKLVSTKWMEGFAAQHGFTLERILAAGRTYIKYSEYTSDGGRFEGLRVPDEYWEHYQNITGEVVPADDRGSFFSCSC